MRPVLPITVLLTLLSASCRKAPLLSLTGDKQNQVIAIQPLDDYNVQHIQTALEALRQYYHKPVIVLEPVNMPGTWCIGANHSYAADSILSYLSTLQNDSIVDVVGLTHKPLFTIKEEQTKLIYDANIIGLGYQPGNACVISDYRVRAENSVHYLYRMRNAMMHEIGHNMGLPHCMHVDCVMSEKNVGTGYCAACKSKLSE